MLILPIRCICTRSSHCNPYMERKTCLSIPEAAQSVASAPVRSNCLAEDSRVTY